MDLSIVIVNYNVKHFIEQCLHSVYNSTGNLKTEIFVVDNNSVDGSCQVIKQKFPDVILIENKENLGFAKANNQAINQAIGRYVLVLNPDTFLQEDTLWKCVTFMDEHPQAGSLGVKMIDGKGNYLPESKRALPTPTVAFYKIFGLSSLFPKSKVFAKYHLGYLNKDKIHKVEILAGAFMFLRKTVLDKVGLLDETFFMYGEDIDLSYRILKGGYENYYFPETTIIHYKGESTKKGSINYVMVFYKAMIIFAQKHFSSKNVRLYSLLINMAIYLRAALGITKRMLSRMFVPVADCLLVFSGFKILTPLWADYRFGTKSYYPEEFFMVLVPTFIVLWGFFLFLFGAYEKKVKPTSIFRGVATGSLIILIAYSLLPEEFRFSRALIFLGSLWTLIVTFVSRIIAQLLFRSTHSLVFGKAVKKIAVVGTQKETERVKGILLESGLNYEYLGRIYNKESQGQVDYLGGLEQLADVIAVNRIDELVFCSQDMSASDIIKAMLLPENVGVNFKIAPPESVSVIGSNSINTAGDLYVVDINSLAKGVNKRKKRMFDILSSVVLLMASPVLVFLVPKIQNFYKNLFFVLIGKFTWIGVSLDGHQNVQSSTFIEGILTPSDGLKRKEISQVIKLRMNIMYAKDYRVTNDFLILVKNIRRLGRQVKK